MSSRQRVPEIGRDRDWVPPPCKTTQTSSSRRKLQLGYHTSRVKKASHINAVPTEGQSRSVGDESQRQRNSVSTTNRSLLHALDNLQVIREVLEMGGITRLNYEERSPLLQDLNKSRGKAIQVPDSDDERSSSFDFSAEHDGIEHTNLNPDAIRKFQEQLTYLENRVREMERGTERPQCLNLKRTANEVVQSADPQEDSHLQARDKNEVQRITVGIPRSWSSASENTSGIFEEPVPHERVSGHEQEVSTVAVDVEKVDRRFLSQEERYSYKNSITTLEQKCFELEIQLEEFVEREKTVRKQLEDARYAAKKLQEEKRTLEQTVHSSAGRESQELKEMQESFQAIVQERDRRIRRLEADVAHWKREAGEWKEQKFKDERNLKTKVSDLEAELLRSQTANQILQNHLQMVRSTYDALYRKEPSSSSHHHESSGRGRF